MSDFGARLERELVAAARRERRRRLRPPASSRAPDVRAALGVVIAIAALAAVLLVLVPRLIAPEYPAPAQPGPVPITLAGNYANGGARLILDRRRYTLLIDGKAPVTGGVTALGEVLALEDDGEGACPATTRPARYLATVAGPQLRLQRLADPCPARAQAFERPLTRAR
jgi:hypothetical protein